MDGPMEELACKLSEIGMMDEKLSDAELVEVATKKLNLLYDIAKTVLSKELLAAVMK